MLLDEQPQSERKARDEAAIMIREFITLDFDLLKSIVSNIEDSLPIEVIIPIITQFPETVEGHFVIEPAISWGIC